ncbi:hypothetical protein DL771_004461 [Monosporascus sp. 5C6A]|nr:hypothetical protein DL771_004461 [Monosporascus sp. 5C6A]
MAASTSPANPLEMVEYLLEKGADPNKPCEVFRILGLLLSSGADPNVRGDPESYFPLHMALAGAHGDSDCPPEVTWLLLEHGAVALIDEQSRPGDDAWADALSVLIKKNVDTKGADPKFAQKLALVLRHHPKALNDTTWSGPLDCILERPSRRSKALLEVAIRYGCDPNARYRLADSDDTGGTSPIRRLYNSIAGLGGRERSSPPQRLASITGAPRYADMKTAVRPLLQHGALPDVVGFGDSMTARARVAQAALCNASYKSIIFSQFTTMLQLIEWRPQPAGISTVML